VVGLQPHPQRRAQRPAGQVDLDLAGPAVPVVLGRSADQALAGAPSAVVRGDLPLSRAATHVPNGTSTIRRNDNQARAGRGLGGPARSGAARPEPAADGTA
jgi:hypothetical protein